MPFVLVHPREGETTIRIAPSREAVVSWNTAAASGEIALRVHRVDGSVSSWLPYVTFAHETRRSHSGHDTIASIDKDVLSASVAIDGIDVRSPLPLDLIAVATPPRDDGEDRAEDAQPPARRAAGTAAHAAHLLLARPLRVPTRSQYHRAFPAERGWCSPASLAMVLAFWGIAEPLERVVAAVRDDAYGGTGNWTFNVAYAARHGLCAIVAYLRGLDALARFTAAGIPVVVSIGWAAGALPGARVEHSDGHLVVVRGCDDACVAVNDPAHPDVATTYPRAAFERAWLGHGGVAYLIVPPAREGELALLAGA